MFPTAAPDGTPRERLSLTLHPAPHPRGTAEIYVATYFATAIVVYSGVRASLLESDAATLNQLADLKYEQLANVIRALATDLTAWSEADVMNDLVSGDLDKRITHALEALKRLYGLSGDLYAFNVAGTLVASSNAGISPGGERLPAPWQGTADRLTFIAKGADPITGGKIVALEIPVFASFDRSYRIGTLVINLAIPAVRRASPVRAGARDHPAGEGHPAARTSRQSQGHRRPRGCIARGCGRRRAARRLRHWPLGAAKRPRRGLASGDGRGHPPPPRARYAGWRGTRRCWASASACRSSCSAAGSRTS